MIRTKSPSPRCCSILSRQFDAAGPILANLLRPDRTERSGAADSPYNLVKPLQTSTTSSRPRSVSNLSTSDHNRPSIFIFKTEYRYIYIYIFWSGIGNENGSLEKIRMPNLEGKSSPRPNQNPRIVGQPAICPSPNAGQRCNTPILFHVCS